LQLTLRVLLIINIEIGCRIVITKRNVEFQVIIVFMVVTKYQREKQHFEFFIQIVINRNKNENIKK